MAILEDIVKIVTTSVYDLGIVIFSVFALVLAKKQQQFLKESWNLNFGEFFEGKPDLLVTLILFLDIVCVRAIIHVSHNSVTKPVENSTYGLAKVGFRAALSFAFAFLRLVWRSGEDADHCGELLQSHCHDVTQEIIGLGLLPWSSSANTNSHDVLEVFNDLGGVQQIVCAEKHLLALSRTGRVYTMYYGSNIQSPQPVTCFGEKEMVKLAAHADGKHYLALTSDGDVYSWGDGDGERLGHGDNITRGEPTLITALSGKHIVHICAGSTYSAAISSSGELYTWGHGNYGRLGHASSEDQCYPNLVSALKGHSVVDVACGSGGAQTSAFRTVYCWSDGDYGKLGLGGSDGCKTPTVIEKLMGQDVLKVYRGAQFSFAFTKSGGKGDNFRLGHGCEDHMRRPKQMDGLSGKRVRSLANGSMHWVAVTEEGWVFCWGRNDQGQLRDESHANVTESTIVPGLDGRHIVCATCVPYQSFFWSSSDHWTVGTGIPFIVDIDKATFEQLDDLLKVVCDGMDGRSDWPPPQDKECIAVPGLNLLNLHAWGF